MPTPVGARVLRACGWIALVFTAGTVQAETPWVWSFAGGSEYFEWVEYDADENELLRETGPRVTLSASVSNQRSVSSGRYRELLGQLYIGTVNYDGETMIFGDPIVTDTDYYGGGLEGVLGYRWGGMLPYAADLDASVSFGYEGWTRDIQPSRTAAGAPVSGLFEVYHILYARLGVGPRLVRDGWTARAQGGVRLPVYTYERAETTGIGCADDVELIPDGRSAFFLRLSGEWPYRTRRVRAEFYYDAFRFDPSELEGTVCQRGGGPVTLVFQQPQSSLDVFGVRIGVLF